MVRVRRANQGTRRTPSIRETSHRIRRNRRTRRLPQIIVAPDNEIIEPTPSTISQSSPPIPEVIEIGSQLPEELSDFILETEERNAEIAPNAVIPDQHNYSTEEDDFYPPPSYSPVTYEDLDPFAPLEIPQIEITIPIVNIDSEHSYILPEIYGYTPEE